MFIDYRVVGAIWAFMAVVIALFALLSAILSGSGKIYCPSCGCEDMAYNADTGLFICRQCHRTARSSEVIR